MTTDAHQPAPRPGARAHRPGRGARGGPRVRAARSPSTASPYACWPTRRPTSGSTPGRAPTGWWRRRSPTTCPGEGCELVLVIGGDGSILRAAELTHETSTPLLGVNLGHVGFLAEAEQEDVESTITAIVDRDYTAEDRLTLDVHGAAWARRWCSRPSRSTRRASRRPPASGCSRSSSRSTGARCRGGAATASCAPRPPGSTAYNFSAGGPVVWPEVEALLMVPLSAHALFARPMVVAPTSVLAVEVLSNTEGSGVLWCDGRRTVDLPPGARIEVRRGDRPGAPGPAAPGAVHRPAGREVRPAGRGLARRRRAPAHGDERRSDRCLRSCGSASSASSTPRPSSSGPA